MIEFNYWMNLQFGGKKNKEKKWDTLVHNGVLFPDDYESHGINLIYDNDKAVYNILLIFTLRLYIIKFIT
jgi:hypothetical protein